ncbi:MAG: FAD-dependent monooxygenase [Wenzhouxiangellaceae bacterium]|nr:FAD-dependent monooxygenase [Wenzhouxiangellaceae bacterium]
MEKCDALVLGGATVGAAAALALDQLGLRVTVVDRDGARELADDAALDPRVVAISPGSRQLIEVIGAWRHVRGGRVAAYHDMQVMSGRGQVEFAAAEHGLPALGWIIELAELDRALWRELAARHRIDARAPAEAESIECGADAVRVRLADGHALEASMLLGADGRDSRVRTAAGIGQTTHHYNQRAIVCHLTTDKLNPGIAWQRFTALGPLALLPLPEGRSSLVWSVHDDEAERLLALDDDAFAEALNRAAEGSPMGPVEALEQRHAYPLIRCQSDTLAAGRVALLGDAARSVHPLAGQGLNLGLGDVAALVAILAEWPRRQDPSKWLARYARRRGSDSRLVAGGIHWINEARATGDLGRHGMGAAFLLMGRSRGARDLFVQRACGVREMQPALERLEAA